ncbi:MAG: PD-(D/E)XK nuclease family protein [Cyanobacteria bacterium Co-bin13]|nr:PD-(D/E)XK nuclease family protein [Cyanobacteria bacterium Co-bin13]
MLTNLTQGHLSLLETCPRKFQQIFLEGLTVPPSPDLQTSQLWGNRFHLLMQQRELGLPLPGTLTDEEHLQACMAALVAQAPDLFRAEPSSFRQSEHRRSLAFNGYSLTVIYDLLILRPGAGLIVDWKTYLQVPNHASLAQDWQTRLYLYVLVETTDLSPEQVAMSYWFVRHREAQTGEFRPQEVKITYTSKQHEQTRQNLLKLTAALSGYQQSGHFPQVSLARGSCDRCLFVAPCGRLPESSATALSPLPSLAEIEEVPL